VQLAKLKHVNLHIVGRHGGSLKEGKLRASIQRMKQLTDLAVKFSPDLTISFCSPEASRVAYGLGIPHIAFSDSPHANAVMRLSVPLVQKLLIPWVIPKNEFVKYGIAVRDIIQYRAIDAAVIVKEKSKITEIKIDISKKTILIRPEESAAAYALGRKNVSNDIISEICKESSKYNIVVLARYQPQVN
jgi:predicted glycosyltransferase